MDTDLSLVRNCRWRWRWRCSMVSMIAVTPVVMPSGDLVHIGYRGCHLRSWSRRGRQRGIKIESSKIKITGGKEGLSGGIDALPDDIENMPSNAGWQIYPKFVRVVVAVGRNDVGQWLQIIPTQRPRWIITRPGNVRLKIAWVMRSGCIINRVQRPGSDRSSRPVNAGQINPGIFGPPSTNELSIRNTSPIITIGKKPVHFVPIVKGLRARRGHGRFGRCALRTLRIFQEHLVNATDGIPHGAMSISVPWPGQQGR
jgi:hypothetical protein